ncbi:endo-1,4-beta-xylanase [Spirosoma oryzicola]|uniref:endo-1,4-beta-xylanase n=1 Tax=Spirosoma oryzicola TaxID=2898794 RepID=UPI001E2C85E1|nr:endo-1,4-beta-xylanase [Spirosoma oryzicola]UHG90685.1 endo-1,4-beta-xylanase [Spirosoma oryzicola]
MATVFTTSIIPNNARNSTSKSPVRITLIAALFSFLFNLVSCSPKTDAVAPEKETTTFTASSLRAIAPGDSNNTLKAVASFPIGASINPQLLASNARYKSVIQENCNSITTENSAKMNRIQPKAGQFNWTDTDALVNFAKQSNMKVHGHTLIWHNAVPDWVTNFQGDSLAWEKLMKTHIQTVVGHYKGKIKSWDVVNEAFEADGTLKKSIWYQHLGPDYIARCFQYAHEADPQALLFYNDNNSAYLPKRSDAVFAMLKNLKQRNIPINGVGLQMHITVSTPEAALSSVISQYASTGLLIHISELDIRMNPNLSTTFVLTDAIKNAHALKYKAIAKIYKSIVTTGQQFGITTWNVGDNDSWLLTESKSEDHPLLFDKDYSRKLSFYGFMQGLSE